MAHNSQRCTKHQEAHERDVREFERLAKKRMEEADREVARKIRKPLDCPDCEREYQERLVH